MSIDSVVQGGDALNTNKSTIAVQKPASLSEKKQMMTGSIVSKYAYSNSHQKSKPSQIMRQS